jgi:hypothetical protein
MRSDVYHANITFEGDNLLRQLLIPYSKAGCTDSNTSGYTNPSNFQHYLSRNKAQIWFETFDS